DTVFKVGSKGLEKMCDEEKNQQDRITCAMLMFGLALTYPNFEKDSVYTETKKVTFINKEKGWAVEKIE
ncbi:MAG: hypothetical protein ACLGPL_09495, partial [Acidobacteriota bacterium]